MTVRSRQEGSALTFVGGAGTVTGSKTLLDTPSGRLLIDCGLFQGKKQLRLQNWEPLPVDPASIDAVLLTHAHIDVLGPLMIMMTELSVPVCRRFILLIFLPEQAQGDTFTM